MHTLALLDLLLYLLLVENIPDLCHLLLLYQVQGLVVSFWPAHQDLCTKKVLLLRLPQLRLRWSQRCHRGKAGDGVCNMGVVLCIWLAYLLHWCRPLRLLGSLLSRDGRMAPHFRLQGWQILIGLVGVIVLEIWTRLLHELDI